MNFQNQSVTPASPPLSKLDILREEIDQIDEAISNLLTRRFATVEKIAAQKKANGSAIKDPDREAIVIAKAIKAANDRYPEKMREIFTTIINQSVALQEEARTKSPSPHFPSVCIIGAGLIGGALARQIREVDVQVGRAVLTAVDLAEELVLSNRSQLFDVCTTDVEEALQNNRLIFLCAPPDVNMKLLQRIAPHLKPGQVVVDVSSVKEPICSAAAKLNLNGATFIGGHPFFGTEQSGFAFSHEVKVANRTFCLVPVLSVIEDLNSSELQQKRHMEMVQDWLEWLGMKVVVIDATTHDRIVSRTSHMIQLFALIAGTIIHKDIIQSGETHWLKLSGGGLATLSRLMGSPAAMWQQIFRQNEGNIDEIVDEIEAFISAFRNTQSVPDSNFLQAMFGQANATRLEISRVTG